MSENQFVKSWKRVVETEFQSLQVLLEKDAIAGAWKRNRESILTHNSHCQAPDIRWNVDTVSVVTRERVKLMQSNSKRVVAEAYVMKLPRVEPLPSWTTWIPVQRNLQPDKEVPTNIPYFGDEVIEKERNFIGSLEEEVNHINLETISDEKFIKLVEAVSNYKEGNDSSNTVLYHPKTNTEFQYYQETNKNPSLPRLIVFQAINSCYPEFGTTEKLIQKYKNLNKSTRKEHFAPDIDGPDAADQSAQETLHTFKSLMCRRCFLFDCPLHKDDPVVDAPVQKSNSRVLPLPTEPCNLSCYMKLTDPQILLSPRTPMTQRSKEKVDVFKDLYSDQNREAVKQYLGGHKLMYEEWTNAEKSMYRVLIAGFPANFCAVAKALGTKTCEEVFRFSVQEGKTSRGDRKKKALKAQKFGRTQQAQLYKHTQDGTKENKRVYVPCNHPGSDCAPGSCSCRDNNNFCEKYCYCPINCKDRFPGCRCRGNCKTKMCPCFLASRECDPDLCMNCLDGKLEWNPETNSCQNVHLQRFMGKKLFIAPSDIAGMGCFIGETAEKGDFIAEYVGEMITNEECESRGRVYDKSKMSYMFALNDEYILDAARFGGIIRFANHSSKPNCQSKILLVNGDHRIGIYAKQRIDTGEELFFDYGKDFVGHDLI